jgi:hypothetical protein
MGKKRSRPTKTSKGERVSIAQETISLVRRQVPQADKLLNKVTAWKKGKNPWLSIDGVRYRMNSLYGNPKKLSSLGVDHND